MQKVPQVVRILAVFVATGMLLGAQAQTLSRELRVRILQSVVQIVPIKPNGDFEDWSGSGTIISPDGYILTNFHVIGDEKTRQYDKKHAIFVTDFADQPPKAKYIAEVAGVDPANDLAVLRIARDMQGKPVTTRFVATPVGDSNDLVPGDRIFIIGYPGIGGSTITYTSGLMSGWVGEDFESGGKAWIKTDGKITGGNSGGAAVNERGELIGVPTAGRTRRTGEITTEQQAYIRPISLAWAVIGPNVSNVLRASGTPITVTPTPPTTPTVGTPQVALAVGPLTLPNGELGSFVAVAFRDPQGRNYAKPGVPLNLRISGPSGWEDMTMTNPDYDFTWATSFKRPFTVGTYNLSGTIDGKAVRASATVTDIRSRLSQPSDLRVSANANGTSVGVTWRSNGAKLAIAELYTENDDFVTSNGGTTTSVNLEPQRPLARDAKYYLDLYTFDANFAVLPSQLPKQISATYTFSKTFTVGQTAVAAPVALIPNLPAVAQRLIDPRLNLLGVL